jgi:LAO/AO transport system kinase
MSSRGHLGGLSEATESAIQVFSAAGFDIVLVETVGVGQSEVEVAQMADTTILLQPPGLGDGVQAVKAGIMEVPALFVVSKGDLPGASAVAMDIRGLLELKAWDEHQWMPPVLMTSQETSNIGDIITQIDAHTDFINQTGQKEVHRLRYRQEMFKRHLYGGLSKKLVKQFITHKLQEALKDKQTSPFVLAQKTIDEINLF